MVSKPVIPNVLAGRYASAEMARLWSAEHKIVLERQLWLAVLRAQADLGVPVPDGAIEAYERVIDQVDLVSIAARERVTRHDVKAPDRGVQRARRAPAGAQGNDQSRSHRERRAAADRQRAAVGTRPDAGGAGPAGGARHHVHGHRPHRSQPQCAGAGNHARQTLRDRGAGAFAGAAPSRRADRALSVAGHQRSGGYERGHAAAARLAGRGGRAGGGRRPAPWFPGLAGQRRAGLPTVAGPGRSERTRAGCRRAGVAGHHHPADGWERAGHRGFQGRTGGFLGDAAQDEQPVVRADHWFREHPARLPDHGRRARRRPPVERGRRFLFGRTQSRAARRIFRVGRPFSRHC